MSTDKQKRNAKRPGSTTFSLIDQLQQNDAQAWQRLYRLYEPLVQFWCKKARLADNEIPDLVQEVFQTVAKNIATFSLQQDGSFRGWLRLITRSRLVDWYRKNKDKPKATGGSVAQTFFAGQPFDEIERSLDEIDADEENQLTQQLYARALTIIRDHFQEKTWLAFRRVVMDGLSPAEVAKELSISPSTVRVAKSRVLSRLRLELGELPSEGSNQSES